MLSQRTTKAMQWAAGGLLGLGLAFLTAQAAEAATLRLGPDCGPTIQDCVDAAADGDLILVPRKTGKGKPNDAYYENVVVDKDVTIRGVNRHPSTACLDPRRAVDPSGTLRRNGAAVIVDAAPAGDPGADGFLITAPGATVECIMVRHGTDGFRIDNDGATLDRVVGLGQQDDGVDVADGDSYLIRNALFIGALSNGIEAEGDDGQVRGSAARNIQDVCFNLLGANLIAHGNHASACFEFGFLIEGQAPTVTRNRADAISVSDGFQIICTGTCGDGLVEWNVATRAGDDGFFVSAAGGSATERLRVQNNESAKNMSDGFHLSGTFLIVRNNKAERTGDGSDNEAGFFIETEDSTYTDNLSRFNGHDGFQVDDRDRNTFERNRAIGNAKDGFDVDGGGLSNVFQDNLATRNEAEGFENNGFATEFRNNTSSENRIDCANNGTIATDTGNTCADGSDFAPPPEVEREVEKADKKESRDKPRRR